MANGITDSPFLWGFLGAFIYAGPMLSACILASRTTGESWGDCLLVFVMAMLVGTVAAGSFGPFVLVFIHLSGEAQNRAVASTIGLLANRASPLIVDALNGRLLRMIRGEK